MEREAEMLFLIFLTVLCFVGMAYHLKRRKFYQEMQRNCMGKSFHGKRNEIQEAMSVMRWKCLRRMANITMLPLTLQQSTGGKRTL